MQFGHEGGRRGILAAVTAIALACGGLGVAAPASALLRTTLVVGGLDDPVLVASPPADARLFIVERPGRIRILQGGVLLTTPFLDLVGQVGTVQEQGMLGLAFPANFATTRLFYVYYTNLAGQGVIARFRVPSGTPNQADPASEDPVLVVPDDAPNHNGGTIAFGPADGLLYFSPGDGGGGGDPFERSQDPQSLLGKLLRIDVSGGIGSGYTIPASNPFAGTADPLDVVRDEIWAFGLRNPFRFSFDAMTGDLWIGDVGQAQREEIDFEPAGSPGGRNYGWDVFEGSLPNATDPAPGLSAEAPVHTPPIHEYTHAEGCSVTGGVVSRGPVAEMHGHYFFGDWCSGTIWTRNPSSGAVVARTDVGPISQVVAFAEGADGSLYAVSLLGRVYRIEGGDPNDADGDTLPNETDPCTVLSGVQPPASPPSQRANAALLRFSNLHTGPGDDRISLRGSFNPAGGTFDPATRGVHLLLEDAGGTLVELDVPGGLRGSPGLCGPRDGWRVSTTSGRPSWSYANASGALPGSGCAPGSARGLGMLSVRTRVVRSIPSYAFSVSISKATLPRVPAFPVSLLRLDLAMARRDDAASGVVSAEAQTGRCTESLFFGNPVPTASVPRSQGGPVPYCKRSPSTGPIRSITCDGP